MTLESLPQELSEFINYEEGLARIRGNKKIYSKTLEMFIRTKEFDNLEEALKKDDLEKAGYIAHTIKGMAGNLSIAKIFKISSVLQDEFEKGIRNEENISELFVAADKTAEYIVLLIKALAI